MIVVTPAEANHVEPLANLLAELDRCYGATDIEPLAERIQHITDALFASPPTTHVLLAWQDAELVGMASYSYLWPAAGYTRSLYLKELYVAEAVQRQGIGQLLMQHLCKIATDRDCSRVEWTTDTINTQAQQFYKTLGFRTLPAKVFYRVDGDELSSMAEGSSTLIVSPPGAKLSRP